MKENRLGPRRWAFVIVAGGAVMALPFTTSRPEPKPDQVVDVEATLLPEANTPAIALASTVTATAAEPSTAAPLPSWPGVPQSPFDELIQQKAVVSEAQPTEEIVPMQPLRPWISAPNMARDNTVKTFPATNPSHPASHPANGLASQRPTPQMTAVTQAPRDAIALASPWNDDDAVAQTDEWNAETDPPTSPSRTYVQSYGHGRKQLPVSASPADQYTVEEIAAKLNLPKEELVSAIVPASEVLPVPAVDQTQLAQPYEPGAPKSSVVLSRQRVSRPVGSPIRFGSVHEPALPSNHLPAHHLPTHQLPGGASDLDVSSGPVMNALPKLPEQRRSHVIFQPIQSGINPSGVNPIGLQRDQQSDQRGQSQ